MKRSSTNHQQSAEQGGQTSTLRRQKSKESDLVDGRWRAPVVLLICVVKVRFLLGRWRYPAGKWGPTSCDVASADAQKAGHRQPSVPAVCLWPDLRLSLRLTIAVFAECFW